jgi:hypothetical protein
MTWRLFGAMLLIPMLSTVEPVWGQTMAKPSPPATDAVAKNPFDSFKTFSATLNGGIGRDHDRKIFRSGNLMRMDFADSYRITDLEKQTTWGVYPHSCRQFSAPDAGSYPFSSYRDFKVERALTTEKETVDGHTCSIENVTFTPSGSQPFAIKMKLWEAEDLQHFPIKIAVEATGPTGKAGSKMEILYTDVNLNAPDANLFKHPANCEPDSAPGQQTAQPTPPPSGAKPKLTEKSPQ